MRNWNFGTGDPLSLTLACDARLIQPDYTNDQIWELRLNAGEPAALALETTYGLRARLMRIFPRILEGNQAFSDPASFSEPPRIRQLYPNYVSITFSPYVGIDVLAEYWVPSSQVITGRIRISNQSIVPRQVRLEWTALLTPQGDGQGMDCTQMAVNTVLSGRTSDLSPVLFMTGGPEPAHGPYPALALDLDLLPGNLRQFTWALASLEKAEASFELARHTTARVWEAELARIEMQNTADWVEIHTGDPEWNTVFNLSQKIAYNLLIGSGPELPRPSFILSRQPDQGFSRRVDGSDYNHLWDGQSALDSYYLSELLLPARADILQDLLCNFLATRAEGGWFDWKPGISGQRGRLMVQPILASLAWKIYLVHSDDSFLEQVYPDLFQEVQAWIKVHDRDDDGIPEWDHPLQTGLENNPTFDRWHPDGQGLDITTVEDPALCAFLVHECQCLIHIADQLKLSDPIPILTGWINHLSQSVESSWNSKTSSYHYLDRDTHTVYRGEVIADTVGGVGLKRPRKLRTPRRLVIQIVNKGETTRNPTLHIIGEGPSGPVEEHIPARNIIWIQHQSVITSQNIFTRVDQIEIEGIDPQDMVHVRAADYTQENLSLLLPLWSQIPNPKRAQKIIQSTLFNPERYGHPFGFPLTPYSAADEVQPFAPEVSMLWNSFMGQALLKYGYRELAADLVTRLMTNLTLNLKREGSFRKTYHADQGSGSGEVNLLTGLAPLGLFLDTLGVRIMSPWKVVIEGNNPFPWPVTVKYRGMVISREEKQTLITFPDGQSALVTGSGQHLVTYP